MEEEVKPIRAAIDDDTRGEDVEGRETGEGPGHFKSKLGLVLSCLGCVVGTGNIWRFPRIVANNSGGEGCLQFLMAWLLFLFLWSIPIILIEYAVGRYTRKSTVRSFRILIGPWSSWCGAWMTVVNTIIGCYYSVVLGWCFFYLFHSVFYTLPDTKEKSLEIWEAMQDSSWPILCHFLSIFLAGLCISKAAASIELVNKIIIPILLLILVFSFYWALSLKYATDGIEYLFTPDWDKFKEPRLWVDAASQNAWDTGAGVGLFLTYATFMRRENGVVKLGTLLPACNNLISLLCCITTFSTVFSVEMNSNPPKSKEVIVELLKDNGKANTGLTFIWMPLLYNSLGTAGRYLCSLFFICLALAGLSSLISILELVVHTLQDMEVPRKYSIPISVTVMFFGGLASALDLDILVNQDFVWSFALIIAGSMMLSIPIRYGAYNFRDVIVNKFGYDDWNLPFLWQIIVKYIAPLEALGLLVWWIIDTIDNGKDKDGLHWYELGRESFTMALLQWCIVLICLVSVNVIWMYWRRSRQTIYTFPSNYGAIDQRSSGIPTNPQEGGEGKRPSKSDDDIESSMINKHF